MQAGGHHNTIPRAGRYPRAHPSGETATSTAVSPEGNIVPGQDRRIDAEARDNFRDDLANKASARILIETEVGGVAALYQFIPFIHSAASSHGEQENNACQY